MSGRVLHRGARRDLLSRLYEPLFIVLLMEHDWQHVLVVPIIIRRMLVLICNYRYNCAQDPRGPNKQSLPPLVVPPVCASCEHARRRDRSELSQSPLSVSHAVLINLLPFCARGTPFLPLSPVFPSHKLSIPLSCIPSQRKFLTFGHFHPCGMHKFRLIIKAVVSS